MNQPRIVSQVIKRLPKPSDHERAMSPVPLVHSSASASQPSTFIPQESGGQPGARIHHSQTVQYHDHRTQQLNVGVDPMDFANMVSEAKRGVQESDERIKGLECLAQNVYSQACSRIQELLGVVESLQLSNQGFQNQIHQLNSEVANVRAQLELQIVRNHELGSRVECSASMLDHKDGENSRLMDEIHQLKDSVDSQRLVLEESQAQNLSLRQRCQDMEMSLAARSAAQPVDQVRSDAPPPPAFSAQLLSMMEALQDLSARMSAVEDAQESFMSIKFRAITARQCLFRFRLLVFLQDLVLFQELPDQGGEGFHQMMAEMVLTMKMKNLFESGCPKALPVTGI